LAIITMQTMPMISWVQRDFSAVMILRCPDSVFAPVFKKGLLF
jgi:hypothetical protein